MMDPVCDLTGYKVCGSGPDPDLARCRGSGVDTDPARCEHFGSDASLIFILL